MSNSKINLKNIKISIVINIMVFLLAITASIIMFTGFKFMHGYEPVLETTKISMFRFFTVDSNLFIGISSLIFAIKEINILKGKIEEISVRTYIIKLMATTSVGLTFFVVFAYLGPISEHGIASMLMNSNLFFHLLIPVISIINFIIFERTNKLKFKHTLFGLIPTLLYGIYYLINIFVHMENGKVSTIYDWYWFVQNGIWTAVIVVPIIFAITYIIGLILWRLNKKKDKNNI